MRNNYNTRARCDGVMLIKHITRTRHMYMHELHCYECYLHVNCCNLLCTASVVGSMVKARIIVH